MIILTMFCSSFGIVPNLLKRSISLQRFKKRWWIFVWAIMGPSTDGHHVAPLGSADGEPNAAEEWDFHNGCTLW